MNVKSIAIFYGHFSSNVGDIAINRGEVNMLKAAHPAATITIVLRNVNNSRHMEAAKASFGPDGVVRTVEVSDDDISAIELALDPAKWLLHCGVGDADLIVLAAGEHFFSYGRNENVRNLFWRSLPAFAAQKMGKRCLIMPSTFGPYETGYSRELMTQMLVGQPRIAARETRSPEVLQEVAPTLQVDALLDPAFFVEPPTKLSADREHRNIALVMRSENWGLRLAPDARTSFKPTDAELREKDIAFQFSLGLCRKILAESGHEVTLFIQTDADRVIAEAVVLDLADTLDASRVRIRVVSRVDDYLEALNAADYVVASRFHALILGMVCGKPGFGIYFDIHGHKIPGLMELIGQADDCIDLSRTKLDQAVVTAFDRCAVGSIDFNETGARIEALRASTRDWLEAQWPDRPNPNELSLASSSSLLEMAGRFYEESSDQNESATAKLRQRNIRIEQRLKDAASSISRTNADLEELKRINSRLQKTSLENQKLAELVKRDAVLVAKLQRRIDQLENSVSFQLGHAFISTIKSPRSIFSLPSKVKNINSNRRARIGVAKIYEGVAAVDLKKRDVIRTIDTEGASGLRAQLAAKHSSNKIDLRNALIAAAKISSSDGDRAAEVELLREAVAIDDTNLSRQLLYEAAHRSADVDVAWDVVKFYGMLGNDGDDRDSRVFPNTLRRMTSHHLSVLNILPEKADLQIESVPDRVCYVLHNSLPYSSGGYATRAQGLALGLRNAGIEVVVQTRPGFPLDIKQDMNASDVSPTETIEGIEYKRLLEPRVKHTVAADYLSRAADALTQTFQEVRPALVVAASNYMTGFPALIAARRLGLPFCYEVRGFWEITRISREPEFEETLNFKVLERLETELCKHADHVFTLTSPMKKELIKRGVAADHITLLPNSCELERFAPRARDEALAARLDIPGDVPVIGYIGTFVQYEGLELLVEAAAELRDRGLIFRLLLVGNENVSAGDTGPIMTEIQRIARERNLQDWLLMPGRVPHEEVEAYYSLIDVAPFPRKAQPVTEMVSPMKPLEAFAMEKAVVASSVAALREMVQDGKTGLIFEKDDVQSLADALAKLIADPALRARLGKEGRKWVEAERTWNATARIAADKIRSIVAERAPASH